MPALPYYHRSQSSATPTHHFASTIRLLFAAFAFAWRRLFCLLPDGADFDA
jgi:hypothetical protein